MCVAACELFGGSRLAAYPTACALEMVHAALLIHDDLPCMDGNPSCRGQPSNRTIYGVDMAILVGDDALFPLGFRHIVSHTPSNLVPETCILRLITEIAQAVGSTGMATGQFLDLEFVQENKFGELSECSAVCGGILAGAVDYEIERVRRYGRAVGVLYRKSDYVGSTGMAAGQFLDLEWGPTSVEFVQENKFSELSECSAVCGGILAGAGDYEIERVRRYGRAVGVLYQVVNDVLEEKMKKEEQGSDEKKKKKGKNYVGVYGVEKALKVVEDLRAKAKRELDGFEKYGDSVVPLYSFVDYAADRSFSFGDSS